MRVCQQCGQKWSWWETVKKTLTLSTSMQCAYCGEKQYYSARFRKRSTIFSTLAIVLIMGSNFIFGPAFLYLALLLALIPIWIFVVPFFIQLANEEELPF